MPEFLNFSEYITLDLIKLFQKAKIIIIDFLIDQSYFYQKLFIFTKNLKSFVSREIHNEIEKLFLVIQFHFCEIS